ncbi:serine hydrolase domain-containing protein [Streptomyces sp. NPDC094034]|uniref:serine hydrolase domain-containing protein n=1 Tax=Streptomyces sp. NPDC094034 TaxID=3155309 RepID=UPI0033173BCE
MSELDHRLADAVTRRDLPFAVAMVANQEGVLWQSSAGLAAPSRPASPDALFRIFSMTKAIGALAASIMIDRGLLAPDTPVASVSTSQRRAARRFALDRTPSIFAVTGWRSSASASCRQIAGPSPDRSRSARTCMIR